MICEHRENRACKAFPNGIPRVIFSEEVLHIRKIEGQTGDFVFKPNNQHGQRGKTFETYKEFFDKQDEIKKEIPELTIDIISQSKEIVDWQKSIFEINRKPRRIRVSKNEELHVFTNNGKILTGEIPKISRFCTLHQQLLACENILNQFTTMRTTVYPNGKCDFEFTKEWSNYLGLTGDETERLLEEVRQQKQADLKRLSQEVAESRVKKIIEAENPKFPVSDNLISIMLEEEGIVLLKVEIEKIRIMNKIPDYETRKKTG